MPQYVANTSLGSLNFGTPSEGTVGVLVMTQMDSSKPTIIYVSTVTLDIFHHKVWSRVETVNG